MTNQTEQQERAELKPCPFCGSCDVAASDLAGWETHCYACGASGPIGEADPSDKQQAIALWNTRAIAASKSEPQADCGECDISFPCHNGKEKCIREPHAQAGEPEVVAWMWQHDETGRIGFVETSLIDIWKQLNPRLKIVAPLVFLQTHRDAMASEKAACERILAGLNLAVDEVGTLRAAIDAAMLKEGK